jgi:deoxyadenosine/deoxycytidine kinase
MKKEYNPTQFFAIEGPAFAGKTTIINYLLEKFPNKVAVLPEASEYVGGDHNFPNVPFANFDAAKASTHFFLELERLRSLEALSLNAHTNLPVLLDRSTPLSSILFYDLLESHFSELHNFRESFKQHALEVFNIELQNNKFFVPERIILVVPKDKETFESRLSRGAKNSMFGHWSSVAFLHEEYKKIINSHFKNKVLILETENTQENLEACAQAIISFIQEPLEAETTFSIFSEYQGVTLVKKHNPNIIEETERYSDSITSVQKLVESK